MIRIGPRVDALARTRDAARCAWVAAAAIDAEGEVVAELAAPVARAPVGVRAIAASATGVVVPGGIDATPFTREFARGAPAYAESARAEAGVRIRIF